MFRKYEFLFVCEDGRKLRGPVFSKKDYSRFQEIADRVHELSVLRLQMGRHRIIIPQAVLEHGHAEIKPRCFLYYIIRVLRTR